MLNRKKPSTATPMINLQIIAAGMLVVAGCTSDSQPEHSAVSVRDSAGVTVVESSEPIGGLPELSEEPILSVGTLEGAEELQLFRVTSAHRSDRGELFIGNGGDHEIRVFGADGSYLRGFGGEGAGPGEFAQFSTIRMYPEGDSILWATDSGNNRVNGFSMDGTPVKTIQMQEIPGAGNPGILGRFATGDWLTFGANGSARLGGPPGSIIEMEWVMHAVAQEMDSSITLATGNMRPRFVNQVGDIIHYPFVPLTPDAIYTTASSSALVGDGFSAELRRINMDGVVTALYRWNAESQLVQNIWDRYQEETLEDMNEDNQIRYQRLFLQDLPLPETTPALESVHVDALGFIWIEKYRLDWESALLWDILDPEGRWLGTIELPDGLQILEIGEAHLVARHRDDLGVERVRVYELTRH